MRDEEGTKINILSGLSSIAGRLRMARNSLRGCSPVKRTRDWDILTLSVEKALEDVGYLVGELDSWRVYTHEQHEYWESIMGPRVVIQCDDEIERETWETLLHKLTTHLRSCVSYKRMVGLSRGTVHFTAGLHIPKQIYTAKSQPQVTMEGITDE